MSVIMDAALEDALRLGPVFPLRPPKNAPAIPSAHPKGDPLRGKCHGECGRDGHGFHDAATDPDRLRSWWKTYPDANIGVRTGVMCDVLDVDHEDFLTGVADLPECETLGGPVARSGGGKWHLYFKPSGLGRHIRFSEHCDWLGTDGYVVVPPSTHRSGGVYEWHTPDGLELTEAPADLVAAVLPIGNNTVTADSTNTVSVEPFWQKVLSPGSRGFTTVGWSSSGLVATVATAAQGERNSRLHWAAIRVGYAEYQQQADNADVARALADLTLAARRAGLDDDEVTATIESGYNTGRSGIAPKRRTS